MTIQGSVWLVVGIVVGAVLSLLTRTGTDNDFDLGDPLIPAEDLFGVFLGFVLGLLLWLFGVSLTINIGVTA